MSGELIKILAIIVISAVLAFVLKGNGIEFSFVLVLAAVAITLTMILENIYPQIDKMRQIFQKSGNIASYFTVAVKALGIAYITGFAADVCRDFGQSALASKAELAGKCSIFILCVPLISAVLDAAIGFLKL